MTRSGASVRVDDAGVTLVNGTSAESVALADLVSVSIRTTDLGPFVDDVEWLLQREDGSVLVVPSESEGVDALIGWCGRLPGFDYEAVVAAASSVDDAVFPCWARAG
jgi:hypothetical protein